MKRVLGKNILMKFTWKLSYSLMLFITITFLAFISFRLSVNNKMIIHLGNGFIFSDFLSWIIKVFSSMDLGTTLSGKPVFGSLLKSFGKTLMLTVSSLIISFSISLILGWYWSNYGKNFAVQTFSRIINLISSIPLFLAAFIIVLLSPYMVIDITSDTVSTIDILIYYLVPIFTLSIFDGFITEMTNFIKIRFDEISSEQFITALEIRGGNIKKHIMKHIIYDLLTIVNSKFVTLIGGAIIIEIIFGWKGIGLQGYNAVYYRDYSLFMGVIIFTTIAIMIFNLTTYIVNHLIKNKYFIDNTN